MINSINLIQIVYDENCMVLWTLYHSEMSFLVLKEITS